MKPSSAKAKGRNFQNKVREMIMEKLGINEHDIKTAVMGESGMDIILSKAGRDTFPYAVECKKVECQSIDVQRDFIIHSSVNKKKKNKLGKESK